MTSSARAVGSALNIMLAAFAVTAGALFAVQALRERGTVVSSEPPPAPWPRIDVAETSISLDGRKLFELPPRSVQVQSGVPTALKPHGHNDLLVVPLHEALSRLPQKNGQEQRDLTVRLAADTPYRIMTEVLFTAGQLGFERFHLSVPASGAGPAAMLLVPAAHDVATGVIKHHFRQITGAPGASSSNGWC